MTYRLFRPPRPANRKALIYYRQVHAFSHPGGLDCANAEAYVVPVDERGEYVADAVHERVPEYDFALRPNMREMEDHEDADGNIQRRRTGRIVPTEQGMIVRDQWADPVTGTSGPISIAGALQALLELLPAAGDAAYRAAGKAVETEKGDE
jgi:hypothetical protein